MARCVLSNVQRSKGLSDPNFDAQANGFQAHCDLYEAGRGTRCSESACFVRCAVYDISFWHAASAFERERTGRAPIGEHKILVKGTPDKGELTETEFKITISAK
jgi:hypothetical protein